MVNMMPMSSMTVAKGKATFTVDPWWEAIQRAQAEQYGAAAMTVIFSSETAVRTPIFQQFEDAPDVLSLHRRFLRDSACSIEMIFGLRGMDLLVHGELPETVLGLSIGRPSRDIVVHPGLDPDAIITDAESMEGMFKLTFDRMASVEVDER